MDPQQELFSALLVALKKEYPDMVYDGMLPPKDTPYPFIYLGDSHLVDDNGIKGAVFGNVFQTIHIYSDKPNKRGTLSKMLLNAKIICRNTNKTTNFAWNVLGIDQQILPDNTTSTPLLHGVLEVEFKFN